MKRFLPALVFAAVAFCSGTAGALDLTCNAYVNDKYYFRFYNDPSAARFQYDVTASQDLVQNLNLACTLWASHRFAFLNGGVTTPEELDYQACLTFSPAEFTFGAAASVYTKTNATYEIGLNAAYSVPMPLEIFSLSLQGYCYSDLRGFYEEARVEPGLQLPVLAGISVKVPLILGAAENGFSGLTFNGLTGFAVEPRITVNFTDAFSVSLTGGYFLSLAGGINSYWHGGVSAGFSLNDQEKQKGE